MSTDKAAELREAIEALDWAQGVSLLAIRMINKNAEPAAAEKFATIRSHLAGLEQPEGWVLVPQEPTEEMIEKFIIEFHNHFTLQGKSQGWAVMEGYKVMIAAAPKHEGERG